MGILYSLVWIIGQIPIRLGLIQTFGWENVPREGGVILASNHQSYWDPPILGCAINRPAYYLAKQELFSLPVLGWILPRVHAVPIRRGTPDPKANKKAIKLLLSGQCLILFPEGTRGRGDRFLEPKSGVGLLALEAKVPVVPVHLQGTRNLFFKWLIGNRTKVRFGSPLSTEWLEKIPADRKGYRTVAAEVMKRIESLR
jgi:1-acyl-sn-glycerol-3-phosphate acyltransferase